MKLNYEDMREAYRQMFLKYQGKSIWHLDIWLGEQVRKDPRKVMDLCLAKKCDIWLEEMGDLYGDSDAAQEGECQ